MNRFLFRRPAAKQRASHQEASKQASANPAAINEPTADQNGTDQPGANQDGVKQNQTKRMEAKQVEAEQKDSSQPDQPQKDQSQYTLTAEKDTPKALTLTAPNGDIPRTLVVKPESPSKMASSSVGSNHMTVKVTPNLVTPNLVVSNNGPNNGPNNSKGKPATSRALIQLDNVVKAYQTPAGEFMALRGINLSIGRGEFVAVVGKSGSGKSTLINMITGIDRPTSGEIYIDNTPIHNLAEGPMAEWRGRNIGIIFQFFQLLPMLSCIENVMLPMDFCNMFKPSEREARALHLLEQVDMVEHAYKLPSEVSGGQQQRVAIARALANDPPLLVADEPTGNLDSRTAEAVFHLFERMVDSGKTILMVTHDDEMAHQVRRTITIADGQIVQQDYHTHQEAESTPESELVAQA